MRQPANTLVIMAAIGLFFLIGASTQDRPIFDGSHRTGLIPPDAQELEQIITTWPRVERVNLNWLGLERVNRERARKGKPPLSPGLAKPLGQDILTSVGMPPGALRATVLDEDTVGDLPVFLDNSDLMYFPPIRSQGAVGSCSSFSSTYYQLSYMTALERGLDITSASDNTNKYSPKWSYNMLNGGTDTGSSLYGNFMLLMSHGAATWAEFPYDTNYLAWCLDASAWRNALSVRIQPVQYSFYTDTDEGIDLIKQLLNNGYILTFGTYISSWQGTNILDDPSTIDDDTEVGKLIAYWLNGSVGGHAMTIVGYNDSIWTDVNSNGTIDPGEKGALRIANSWGSSWVDGGFIWLAYDALKSPSAVAGGPSTGRVAAIQGNIVYIMAAREDYVPSVIAEFTVNHAKRNQLSMTLGHSDTSSTTPTTTWTPYALTKRGGAYAFDGSTTAIDGTFVLDFTDIMDFSGATKRFYVGLADDTAEDTATLSAFKIIDMTTDPDSEAVSSLVPQYTDDSEAYAYVDYSYAGPISDHAPYLKNGQVSPAVGTTADAFVFWVWYSDLDETAPSVKNVYIDGSPYGMTSHSSYPEYEGWYYYQTYLSLGEHEYYFQFEDGTGQSVVHPFIGVFSGPTVTPTHFVTEPNVPAGETAPVQGRGYTYSTSGGSCNLGHDLQYRFDWGDGSFSDWLAVGELSAQHSWSVTGLQGVKAQARCATDPSVESDWSSSLTVDVVESPAKNDFNGDGQEDILWRYYGAGGNNLVWYLEDTGLEGRPPRSTELKKESESTGSSPVLLGSRAKRSIVSRQRFLRQKSEKGSPVDLRDMPGAMTKMGMSSRQLKDPRSLGWLLGQTGAVDHPQGYADPRHVGMTSKMLAAGDESANLGATGVLGLAAVPAVPDLTWEIVGTGDFNNDTHTDILWRYNGPGGYNLVWYMEGVVPIGLEAIPAVEDLNWRIVGTGDFNDDGHIDILWRYNGTGGYNLVWYMEGVIPIGLEAVPAVSDLTWQVVGTGDFNDDGHIDILWRYNGTGGYNLVWYMEGVIPIGLEAVPAVTDSNWQIVGTGDYDNDTHIDILWRYNGEGGHNLIWYMDGVLPMGLEAVAAVSDLNWRIVSR